MIRASRLDTAVHFVRDAVEEIGKCDPVPTPLNFRRRSHAGSQLTDMYDEIADLMFKLVLAASNVTSDQSRAWSIQRNAVSTRLLGPFGRGKAWAIVQFKLRRLI